MSGAEQFHPRTKLQLAGYWLSNNWFIYNWLFLLTCTCRYECNKAECNECFNGTGHSNLLLVNTGRPPEVIKRQPWWLSLALPFTWIPMQANRDNFLRAFFSRD